MKKYKQSNEKPKNEQKMSKIKRFLNIKSSRKEILLAAMGGILVQFSGAVLSFFLSILLARYLKPEGLGLYSMVWAAMLVLSMISQLGLSELATREIAAAIAQKDFRRAKGVIVGFPAVVALASAAIIFFAFFIFNFYKIEKTDVWKQALIALPLMALISNLTGMIRGMQKVVIAQCFDAILRPLLFAMLLTGAFSFKGTINAKDAFLLLTITLVIVLIMSSLTLFQSMPNNIFKVRPAFHFHAWQKAAIPMFIAELSWIFFSQYPFLLLGSMVSLNDAGMYRVAYTMSVLQGMPISVLNLSLMPHIARLYAINEKEKLQRMISTSSALSLISTLGISILFFFFGQYLIRVFFGIEYINAWPLLMLLSLVDIIRGFTGSVIPLLNMTGEEKVVRNILILNLIISFGLSIVFLPLIGTIALPMAIIASEAITRFLLWSTAKKRLHIDATALPLIRHIF